MAFEQSDYIPSTIPQTTVQAARDAYSQGDYAGAWQILADAGDRYADNAAGVIGGGDAGDQFFHELVRNHWESTVGAEVYATKFDAVAGAHLNNYLLELEAGYIPSTQDILNSYEDALQSNGIDVNAAFDGAWAKAVPGNSGFGDSTWGLGLDLDISRITTSETTNSFTWEQATALLWQDFKDTAIDLGLIGTLEAIDALERRGETAIFDYFMDTIGSSIANALFGKMAYGADKNPLNPQIGAQFTAATVATAPVRRDPLTFDLDNDGLETTGIDTANPLYFDHNADGVKTATGWVAADDAFLVLDKNANGSIDNGRELFGDAFIKSDGQLAADGFDALRDLDSNADGVVDAADAQFANLRLWRDLNQDGVSQANELFTLDSQNIAAINTGSTEHSQILANGNQLADLGSFVKTDGSSGTLGEVSGNLGDINLVQDTFHSQFADTLDTTGFEALPDMQGAGQVRSLREAATLSPVLAQLLTDFAAADRTGQQALLDAIVKAWSDTSPMAATFTGAYDGHSLTVNMQNLAAGSDAYTALAGKLTILERFNGRTFNAVPDGTTAATVNLWTTSQDLLQRSYDSLSESVYQSLVTQTRLKPYLDAVGLQVDTDGIRLDFSGMNTLLENQLQANAGQAVTDALELLKYHGSALNPSGWNGAEIVMGWENQLPDSFDFTRLLEELGFRTATAGDDLLIGTKGADTLFGGGGNDNIWGGDGDDTLTLTGRGSSGVLEGGDGNDILSVNAEVSGVLNGGAGDDVLGTAASGDLPYWAFAMTLNGGTGNDILNGGHYGDTYLFNLGDGHDRINDNQSYSQAGQNDRLVFGAGISADDLKLVRVGNDLVFQYNNGADSVTVSNWYASSSYRIEQVEFADGTVWGQTDIKTREVIKVGFTANESELLRIGNDLVFRHATDGNEQIVKDWYTISSFPIERVEFLDGAIWNRSDIGQQDVRMIGTAANDTLTATEGRSIIQGLAGNDTLTLTGRGSSGVLEGGDGNDILSVNAEVSGVLNGGAGDDVLGMAASGDLPYWAFAMTLNGGIGNDILNGGHYGDTYLFNLGDGHDRINDNQSYSQAGQNDRLVFGAGISADDLKLVRVGNDLVFQYNNGADSVTVSNWYASSSYRVERVEFADGTVWNQSDIMQRDVFKIDLQASDIRLLKVNNDLVLETIVGQQSVTINNWYTQAAYPIERVEFLDGTIWTRMDIKQRDVYLLGTATTDILTATEGRTIIQGLAGNDTLTLTGRGSSGVLEGGDGNDILSVTAEVSGVLNGGAGDDVLGMAASGDLPYWAFAMTLNGGIGNDILNGGHYGDTYLFNLGDGHDRINDNQSYSQAGQNDRLVFGAGISADDLKLVRVGNDLVFQYNNGADSVTVSNWYASSSYRIEQVEFADGTVWNQSDMMLRGVLSSTPLEQLVISAKAQLLDDGAGARMEVYIDGMLTSVFDVTNTSSYQNYVVDPALLGAGGNRIDVVFANDAYIAGTPAQDRNLYVAGITVNGQTIAANSSGVQYDIGKGISARDGVGLIPGRSGMAWGGALRFSLDGNDYLPGGSGADILAGGFGDDTYVINNVGDSIIEGFDGGFDTILSSLSFDLRAAANVENLTLTGTQAIDAIGNSLNNTLLGNASYNRLDGGLGIDRLEGGQGNDIYVVDNISDFIVEAGNAGEDTVEASVSYTLRGNIENLILTGTTNLKGTGNGGNNRMQGNAGNNYLSALGGNDVLNGGAGNDTLVGGTGDDTYIFGHGYAIDSVVESDASLGNIDTLQFLPDISVDQLWFRHVGNNLEVDIIGTDDTLVVQNWYSGSANHVEQFTTSNGLTLLDSQVENLVNAMAAFAPPSAGQTSLPQDYQTTLAPVLAANWQ